MHTKRPALGEMLEEFVKWGANESRPEPLNAGSQTVGGPTQVDETQLGVLGIQMPRAAAGGAQLRRLARGRADTLDRSAG